MHKNPLGYPCFSREALEQTMGTNVPFLNIPASKNHDIKERLKNKFNIEKFSLGNEFQGKLLLPDLLGEDIEQHFEAMSQELLDNFDLLIYENLYEVPPPIPPLEKIEKILPKLKSGWNRIQPFKGNFYLRYVPGILEEFAIFDTETFVQGSEFASPIIGTALTSEASYIWLHPCLLDKSIKYEPMLIDLGKVVKVIVGHNVCAYDRPRTLQAYTITPFHKINLESKTQEIMWLDTMAMHQVVAGICEDQAWAYRKNFTEDEEPPYFTKFGTTKSLIAAYNFHCNGTLEQADKKLRDIFVTATTLDDIRGSLPELLQYALKDVFYTGELFKKVFPKYREQAPSQVILASHHLLGQMVLPVANDWHKWKYSVESYCNALEIEATKIIKKWLDIAYKLEVEDREEDIWWENLPKSKPAIEKVGIKSDTCHYLFKMKWNGSPILKDKNIKWSYRDSNGLLCRLPHKTPKTGEDNVGNIFSGFYYQFFEQGILTTALSTGSEDFKRLIEIQHLLGYWISIRKRVMSQPTMATKKGLLLGLGTNPHNTISSRIGQELWLTVAAHNGAKPGAELKYKTTPQNGYKIINFDFSQQELNVLAAYGDSYYGVSGATALGNGTLVGNKKDKSDVASKIGQLAGVSRQEGKMGMYATCYGAGAKKLHNTLRMPLQKAYDLQKSFKGSSNKGSRYYFGGIASESFNKMTDIISQRQPKLPMLGTWMQPALTPKVWGKTGAPGQLNFTVQASGTSILQATCVATTWLIKQFGIDARFIFSLHDELVFHCRSEDSEVLMYLIEIAHVWVWAFLHYKLKIYDLPIARAFVPINRDIVWRKEAYGDESNTETPTFPKITEGEELTIHHLSQSPTLTKIQKLATINKVPYKIVTI